MLTEFRTDYIPFCKYQKFDHFSILTLNLFLDANPRHVKTVHREKYKGSDVFADVLQSD